MKTIEIRSLHDITRAAHDFVIATRGYRKFAFYGPMGSGKTTLIKAICKQLGANDMVTSPTFALVNEYLTTDGNTLYHFDLYRINSIAELFDLGYEEYFYGESYVFIEWADKAEQLLPDDYVRVTLADKGNDGRLVQISL